MHLQIQLLCTDNETGISVITIPQMVISHGFKICVIFFLNSGKHKNEKLRKCNHGSLRIFTVFAVVHDDKLAAFVPRSSYARSSGPSFRRFYPEFECKVIMKEIFLQIFSEYIKILTIWKN